ncbi:hypothetical protein COO60DRAFT_762041 [Scenedesmus sp. NREL 46B-D3]|nr:hypothetical protein COO60DRAFT_762041 [Scenedesmus sp. NREL 46B-D3]
MHFVEVYAADAALQSSSSSSSNSEGAAGWWSHGSPLTLVHLLALAVPSASLALLQALLRTAGKGGLGPAALFKHELTLHAGINTGKVKACVSVNYAASPGIRLIPHKEHPLLLALSPYPLQPGLVGLSSVKQLFSSFAWDEDVAVATLLLPESVAEKCPSWARYVTLCVVSGAGVEAVGVSKQLLELAAAAARTEVQPWRPLPAAVQPQALLRQLDCSLLQQVGAPSDSSSSSRSAWQSVVHAVPGAEQVLVDVLAPSAVHAGAAVKAVVCAGVLTVTLSEAPAKQSAKPNTVKQEQGADASSSSAAAAASLKEGQFSVQLPHGAVGNPPAATKMSRSLGLLAVRVAMSL